MDICDIGGAGSVNFFVNRPGAVLNTAGGDRNEENPPKVANKSPFILMCSPTNTSALSVTSVVTSPIGDIERMLKRSLAYTNLLLSTASPETKDAKVAAVPTPSLPGPNGPLVKEQSPANTVTAVVRMSTRRTHLEPATKRIPAESNASALPSTLANLVKAPPLARE